MKTILVSFVLAFGALVADANAQYNYATTLLGQFRIANFQSDGIQVVGGIAVNSFSNTHAATYTNGSLSDVHLGANLPATWNSTLVAVNSYNQIIALVDDATPSALGFIDRQAIYVDPNVSLSPIFIPGTTPCSTFEPLQITDSSPPLIYGGSIDACTGNAEISVWSPGFAFAINLDSYILSQVVPGLPGLFTISGLSNNFDVFFSAQFSPPNPVTGGTYLGCTFNLLNNQFSCYTTSTGYNDTYIYFLTSNGLAAGIQVGSNIRATVWDTASGTPTILPVPPQFNQATAITTLIGCTSAGEFCAGVVSNGPSANPDPDIIIWNLTQGLNSITTQVLVSGNKPNSIFPTGFSIANLVDIANNPYSTAMFPQLIVAGSVGSSTQVLRYLVN